MDSTTLVDDPIKLVFNDLTELNLKMCDQKNSKSAEESIELRKKGNAIFLKNIQAARLLYNKSIAIAPYPCSKDDKSRELAVAFADRSHLFLALNKYESCLKDIDQALLFDYPKKHRESLYKRREKCLENLNKFHHAPPKPYQITYGQHKDIDCASDCIEIKYTAELGEHLVAVKDITPGDVVIVEKPFASILWPENFYSHCFNCFQRHDSLIPCKKCSVAMYCSEACRNASWETFHHIECPFLLTLVNNGTEVALLLALRIFLVACHNSGDGLRGLYRNQSAHEYEPDQPTKPSHLATMHQTDQEQIKPTCQSTTLQTDEWKNNNIADDVDKVSIKAACILMCLENQTNFFQLSDGDNLNGPDLKVFAGTMLAKYLMVVHCNSFTLKDLVTRVGQRVPTVVKFGSAVYSTASLMRHSGDANVMSCFQCGDTQVVIAIQPIKRGVPLLLAHSPKYIEEEWNEGQSHRQTANLRFKCVECNAPLPVLRVSARPASISTCFWCKHKNDLGQIEKTYHDLYDSYANIKNSINFAFVRPEIDTTDITNIIITLDRIVCPPCMLAKKCKNLLKTRLLLRGNFFTLP